MNQVKSLFNTKEVNAFNKLCTPVSVIDTNKPSIEDKFVKFENPTTILYKATDKIFPEDIIVDTANRQRFVVLQIDQSTENVKVLVDNEEKTITCKKATIKKYNPMG